MAIITYPLNNVLYQAEDAETHNAVLTSGVFADSSHFAQSVTGNREITISSGIAWIHNHKLAGKSVAVNSPEVLTFAAADNAQDRIDRIVLGFSAVNNATTMYVKKGTPSARPVAPARSTTESLYELVLYDVLIPHGSTAISNGDITDQRGNKEVCGFVRSAVEDFDVPKHAERHAQGGDDEIKPADIGAATTDYFEVTIPVNGYDGYSPAYDSYYTEIPCAVLASDTPIIDVKTSRTKNQALSEVEEYNNIYHIRAESGKLIIYSKAQNLIAVTLKVKVIR